MKIKSSWSLAVLAVLTVVLLIAAQCGGAPTAAPTEAPEAASSAAPASSEAAPASSEAAPASSAAAPASSEAAPASSSAAASTFDWKKYSGTELKLLLNKHNYSEALLAEIKNFEDLTGIKCSYDIFPEQNYFDKVTIDLSSGQGGYDVFMTGAYMIWQYAPAGWMEPLEGYINDPAKTNPDYDFNDIIEGLRTSEAWNLKAGVGNLGQGSQYAIPWGFEGNALMYRYDIFEKEKITPPASFDELIAVAKQLNNYEPGMAGIVVRGSKNWATIHPGYMTQYSNEGCKDYDDKMHPVMNSDCSVAFTDKWVKMVKDYGPKAWTTYTWYQAGSDFGAGKAAMLYDADILGHFNNLPGSSAVAGNIAWVPGPKGKAGLNTNIWIWSLAMNANSKKKDAAWYFMQWATGKDFLKTGAIKYALVDPVRTSIASSDEYIKHMEADKDYIKTFNEFSPNAKIQFTPQPLFFETTTEWAATLQDIHAGSVETKAGLDALVEKLTTMLKQAGIYQE